MGRMKKVETAVRLRDEQLFKLIRNYLLVYLPVQREASPHTVTNYRTVLSQYLSFAAEKNGIKLNAVTFDMFNLENVDAYLDYLTAGKKYSPATRNNRLAAIRAFVSYASACYPEYMALESELSAIKVQKDDPFSKVDYMTEKAVTALLNEPNTDFAVEYRHIGSDKHTFIRNGNTTWAKVKFSICPKYHLFTGDRECIFDLIYFSCCKCNW